MEKYEDLILPAITDCAGLDFKVNLLKVYIVSGNPRSLSDPIIIKSGYKPEEFVENLTHELIHQIFDLNQTTMEIYEEEYTKDEPMGVKQHVIVHAILKYIYLDILNEKHRLERDIENSKKKSLEWSF